MACGRRFQSISRPEKLEQIIFEKYVNKRSTLKDLANEYSKSVNWVRSKINAAQALKKEVAPDGYAFVADVTFFERACGFLIYLIPELNIPNTTNSLDGSFSFLKEKTNMHRGFTKGLRDKIIEHILGN